MIEPDQDRLLHTTQPHGSQEVRLHEDDTKPGNRIYVILNEDQRWVPILGSEIESLCSWWSEEQSREGIDEEIGTEGASTPTWDPRDESETFAERREEALEHLQNTIDALGPITDRSGYTVRETILDLIDQLYAVGQELEDVRFDPDKREQGGSE